MGWLFRHCHTGFPFYLRPHNVHHFLLVVVGAANAVTDTASVVTDMAVSNRMAVVYTVKAWSKLRPMPCLLLIVAVVIIGIIVSFCQVIITT